MDLERLRQQGRGSGTDTGSNEVTRRSRALAAARAVAQIQRELASGFRRPQPGDVSQRVNAALQPFGFRSVDELGSEMRELGMSPDAGTEDADGRPSLDERIDELVMDGMTNDEIKRVLEEEGYYVGGG